MVNISWGQRSDVGSGEAGYWTTRGTALYQIYHYWVSSKDETLLLMPGG